MDRPGVEVVPRALGRCDSCSSRGWLPADLAKPLATKACHCHGQANYQRCGAAPFLRVCYAGGRSKRGWWRRFLGSSSLRGASRHRCCGWTAHVGSE